MEYWLEESYCDGCHRTCSLTRPGCHYGRNLAEDLRSEREARLAAAPTCPHCHIGCSLADPNCGRCAPALEQWMRGEKVVTREEVMQKMRAERGGKGGPGPRGPQGGRPGPGGMGPGDDASKMAKFVPMGAKMFENASKPMAEGRFLMNLHGAMKDWVRYGVLEEKMRTDAKNIYPMIDHLLDQGLLVREGDTLYITEAGVQAADKAQAEAAENNARLFEALTQEELSAFAASWEKLVHHWAEMGGRPR